MFKKVLLALVVLIAAFVVLVATQPDEFNVSRTAVVDASASDVFQHVNTLKKWNAWSPWAQLDPEMSSRYVGPVDGEGAVMHWMGNDEVGEGTMEVIESRQDEIVRLKLDFVKPMEGTSTSEFKFVPQGEKTAVTWSMSGNHSYVQKAMCLVFNGKKMLGGQFEQGLSNLNDIVSGKSS